MLTSSSPVPANGLRPCVSPTTTVTSAAGFTVNVNGGEQSGTDTLTLNMNGATDVTESVITVTGFLVMLLVGLTMIGTDRNGSIAFTPGGDLTGTRLLFELRMQEEVDLVGLDATHRLVAVDQALRHHVDGDPHLGLCRALAVARLQDPELAALDRAIWPVPGMAAADRLRTQPGDKRGCGR